MLNVGDKVVCLMPKGLKRDQVREGDFYKYTYNNHVYVFAGPMCDSVGKVYTIKSKLKVFDNCYTLEDNFYYWHESWLQIVEDEENFNVEICDNDIMNIFKN